MVNAHLVKKHIQALDATLGDAARRLDKTVFASFVRKLLENPVSEGYSLKNETPEVVGLQELEFIAGSGFEPLTFGL